MNKTTENKVKKLQELLEIKEKAELEIEKLLSNGGKTNNGLNDKGNRIRYTDEVLSIFSANEGKQLRAKTVFHLLEQKLGKGSVELGSIKSTIIYLHKNEKIKKMDIGKYTLKKTESENNLEETPKQNT